MTALKAGAPTRQPRVAPTVVVVGAAGIVWALALERHGYAIRFPAVPAALMVFLAVQLLVPRVRWNSDRVLGPGNVATTLFFLQLVVIPTLLVVSGPHFGTLRFIPADQHINTALLLQALGYACYAVGYVAWTKPVRPRPFLVEPGLTTGIALAFIAFGAVGLAVAFPSPGALIDYFSGQGAVFGAQGPASIVDALSQFLRPFLTYGVIILWALLIARRRPGARLQPLEFVLMVVAVVASATYDYNRASVVIPLLALVTAYSRFGRRQSPLRIAALLAILAFVGFAFGEYRSVYEGTQGGAINPAEAGLDQPGSSFTDNLQNYGNGPQFWAVLIQEVDRTGFRHGDSIIGSTMYPVPVLGKPFRSDSGPIAYNELIYGEPDIRDQIIGFGAELYWNFGVPGIIGGYFLLGFAVRRFDDRVDAAADALAAYSWSYCGIWVALLTINSISVLSQTIVYFFWPIFVMCAISYLARSHPWVGPPPLHRLPTDGGPAMKLAGATGR